MATSQSSTSLFRRLTWQASVPLEIRLADGEPGSGSGADKYYMQAPRYSYLPLLIPEIRENLVELCLDDQQLAETDEKDWWFEEDPGEPSSEGFASQGACRWHWPIDLIELHSTISYPSRPESSTSANLPKPLRLVLHLSAPPTDKLMMPNSIDACRTQFVNQVKEGDFVRWGNTKKVTGLRRADLEAGWDGIVQDDYDLHSRMSSRIFPLPIPSTQVSTPSMPSRPPSTDPGGSGSASKPESSYTARSLPMKIYLPDGAPVIQEIVPPIGSDGKPTTLVGILRQHLPLLFPSSSKSSSPFPIAFPIAQGVELPPEAEVAWLAACMSGPDGWLRIGIRLKGE